MPGNKIDLDDQRVVPSSMGAQLAARWRCKYLETSAKTRVEVEVFIYLRPGRACACVCECGGSVIISPYPFEHWPVCECVSV